MAEVTLTTAGPVQQGTYLARPSDEDLLVACKAGQFSYILASRQIGKSSLMYKTAEKLSQEQIVTAIIDLTRIGHDIKEADTWYFSLIDELAHNLKLSVNVESWWAHRPNLSSPTQRFLRFLEEGVLAEIPQPIVIFIDEIDETLTLDFTDDFFAAIRSVHHNRAQNPEFNRLTFVLLGVATPDELIASASRTPFNIGQEIRVRDFTLDECWPLRQAITGKYPHAGDCYFERIYHWTAGHPYLTQRLCYEVAQAEQPEQDDLVDKLVEKQFLEPRGRGDQNLRFVQDRVTGDAYAQQMLRLYKQVLQGEKPVQDNAQSTPISRLKLYGLVVVEGDYLKVRNQLYLATFDLTWVEEMLYQTGVGIPSSYKIVQEIGPGGIARVYLAQPQENGGLSDLVAVKVLDLRDRSETEWDEWLERFKAIRSVIEKLDHPHIIPIFEAGWSGQQTLFVVMGYFSHGTLRSHLKDGPLSLEDALTITSQIGSALGYAHSEGLVHRDVKPGNILLDASESWQAVLSDFGLVDILSSQNLLTQIKRDKLRATARYLAPEQWRGEPPSAAADIYALAITFFEMVAGRPPFTNSSVAELEQKHLRAELPLLSDLKAEVGPFFDRVLKKATAKNPMDRYRAISEFVADLRQAYEQRKRSDQDVKQVKAGDLVRAAKSYMEYEAFNPDIALMMIDGILDLVPNHQDALRLKGQIKQKQGTVDEALAIYDQLYQQDPDPLSIVGQEYLAFLNHVASAAWQIQKEDEAVRHYERIMRIWGAHFYDDAAIQQRWQEARTRLINHNLLVGQRLYDQAKTQPIDLTEAIEALQKNMERLEYLRAHQESKTLNGFLKDLKIRHQTAIIELSQAALRKSLDQAAIDLKSETVFDYYRKIDDAYRALLTIEPSNENWQAAYQSIHNEQAHTRYFFAQQVAGSDYLTAIRHYRAILNLEQSQYEKSYLQQLIQDLEKQADHEGRYRIITQLITQGEPQKALERLEDDFIRKGNYEYRDVARLLWELLYVRDHGRFPPEQSFERISQGFLALQLVRVQAIKKTLEPWLNVANRLAQEQEQMAIYTAMIEEVRLGLRQMSSSGLDIESPQRELDKIDIHLQMSQELFAQILQPIETGQIENWFNEVETISAELQKDDLLENKPQFLADSHKVLLMIEQNQVFESLQSLELADRDLPRKINEVRSQLQVQQIESLRREFDRLQEKQIATALKLRASEEASNLLRQEAKELAEVRAERDRIAAESHSTTLALARLKQALKRGRRYRKMYTVLLVILPMLAFSSVTFIIFDALGPGLLLGGLLLLVLIWGVAIYLSESNQIGD